MEFGRCKLLTCLVDGGKDREEMRLIDADALLQEIEGLSVHITGLRSGKGALSNFMNEYRKTVLRIIDEQPTAFDTEKVVEQLMIIHDEGYCPNEDSLECVLDKTCSDCYREKIIDIVKKGGVE